MGNVTLYWSAPWTAVSSAMVGELIGAGASACPNSARRARSLYDLVCNEDDVRALRAARARHTDPVTLAAIDEDLVELADEHAGLGLVLGLTSGR